MNSLCCIEENFESILVGLNLLDESPLIYFE